MHKTATVLDKMAKSTQVHAKKLTCEMDSLATKEKGLEAFESFISLYEAKYPKATDCLRKDRERGLTFYDFPALQLAAYQGN